MVWEQWWAQLTQSVCCNTLLCCSAKSSSSIIYTECVYALLLFMNIHITVIKGKDKHFWKYFRYCKHKVCFHPERNAGRTAQLCRLLVPENRVSICLIHQSCKFVWGLMKWDRLGSKLLYIWNQAFLCKCMQWNKLPHGALLLFDTVSLLFSIMLWSRFV